MDASSLREYVSGDHQAFATSTPLYAQELQEVRRTTPPEETSITPVRVSSRCPPHQRRPRSPSTSSTASEAEPIPLQQRPPTRQHRATRNRRRGAGLINNTIRSVQSVPVMNLPTWDGEPCPVHHVHNHTPMSYYPPEYASLPPSTTLRRAASTYDLRLAPISPPPIYAPLQSLQTNFMTPAPDPYPSLIYQAPPQMQPQPQSIPTHLLPPLMRPRPLVVPAEPMPMSLPLPLPVRDPMKSKSPTPLPPKDSGDDSAKSKLCRHECRGGLLVLCIIICVIGFGILLTLVLRFTIS